MGYHSGIAKTGYSAVIDGSKCDYCGACFAACNVKAIGMAKGEKHAGDGRRFAAVSEELCLGCAACIAACKKGALTLVPSRNRPVPPFKRKDLFVRILKEKKRLLPYLASGLKKGLRDFLRGKVLAKIPMIKE